MQHTTPTPAPALLSDADHLKRQLDATLFDPDDDAAIRRLLASHRALAQEVERLTKRLEEAERVRSCAITDHVAAETRAAALEQRVRALTEALRDAAWMLRACRETGEIPAGSSIREIELVISPTLTPSTPAEPAQAQGEG